MCVCVRALFCVCGHAVGRRLVEKVEVAGIVGIGPMINQSMNQPRRGRRRKRVFFWVKRLAGP